MVGLIGSVMTLWSHFRNLSSTRSKLAESAIWQEQTAYYRYHGIASWDNRVPYEVSNSVYFAEGHADRRGDAAHKRL